MRTSLLIACCLFAGCGLPPEGSDPQAADEVQRERSGIVGGVTDTGDPAVVALTVQGQEYCTGTLVGPKTILTAAHCVNVYGTQTPYYAAFGTYASQPTQRVRIISQIAHPSYNPNSGVSHDFGVLQLASAVTNVTPIPMNEKPMNSSHVGMPIRHSGFGITSGGGGGGGTKRQVSYNVRQVTSALIESGAAGKQTCSGDSGGPAFMVMPGNTAETLVGVVSFGDQSCNQFGEDGRVDFVLPWITQTMSPWEGPTCASDGQCKAGCTPVDQDCACAADSVCNPDCAELLKDPDCPRNCVTNGICATEACPRPDADCVAEGSPCVNAQQCKGRVCVGDEQHANLKYCSSACSPTHNPCATGMECAPQLVCLMIQKPVKEPGAVCTSADFCSGGGVCTGPNAGGITRCVQGCSVQSDCPAQTTCEGGANGTRFCRAPEAVLRFSDIVLERAVAQGAAAATGCAAAGGGDLSMLTALLGGLSLIRRRRS
ncbi:MAG: Alkaline serine protease [Myxococcaceae bacterium]|nr:Alkaline serine protease [Myxococcaceae bacterium]